MRLRSTFSSCFKSGSIYDISHETIICNVFLNLGTYFLFTILCFFLCRPFSRLSRLNAALQRILPRRWKTFELFRNVSKRETIAICFCGAAKTTALGIPMVSAIWGHNSELQQSQLEIPVVLYTTEQIFFAQLLVYVFKNWLERGDDAETPPDEIIEQSQNTV